MPRTSPTSSTSSTSRIARPQGPFGAAGVGELPLTSPHVAVVNAIKNATGVRITHLPARPEKVLAGLKELEAKKGEKVPA